MARRITDRYGCGGPPCTGSVLPPPPCSRHFTELQALEKGEAEQAPGPGLLRELSGDSSVGAARITGLMPSGTVQHDHGTPSDGEPIPLLEMVAVRAKLSKVSHASTSSVGGEPTRLTGVPLSTGSREGRRVGCYGAPVSPRTPVAPWPRLPH
jgi:hypothetical protein